MGSDTRVRNDPRRPIGGLFVKLYEDSALIPYPSRYQVAHPPQPLSGRFRRLCCEEHVQRREVDPKEIRARYPFLSGARPRDAFDECVVDREIELGRETRNAHREQDPVDGLHTLARAPLRRDAACQLLHAELLECLFRARELNGIAANLNLDAVEAREESVLFKPCDLVRHLAFPTGESGERQPTVHLCQDRRDSVRRRYDQIDIRERVNEIEKMPWTAYESSPLGAKSTGEKISRNAAPYPDRLADHPCDIRKDLQLRHVLEPSLNAIHYVCHRTMRLHASYQE
jgi:hypothetical protein